MCNQEAAAASRRLGAANDAGGMEHLGKRMWESAAAQRATDGAVAHFLGGCLPFLLLGGAAGVAAPCYLASLGLFQAKFKSDYVFAGQVAAVTAAQLVATLLEEELWGAAPRPPRRSLLQQLLVFSLMASAALLHTPACQSQAAVFAHGVVVSMSAKWLFGAAARFAALEGAGILTSVGCALGSFVAAIMVSACHFGLATRQASVYAFYGVAAGICTLGTWLALWIAGECGCSQRGGHPGGERWEDEDDEDSAEDESAAATAARPSAPGEEHHGGGDELEPPASSAAGSQALLEGVGRESDSSAAVSTVAGPAVLARAADGGGWCGGGAWGGCLLCGAGIMICHATSMVLLPLFPQAGAAGAVLLFQMKCLGDCLGRLAATVHSSDLVASAQVGCTTRLAAVGVAGVLRPAVALPVIAWLLAEGRRSKVPVAPLWLVLLFLVGIFATGGHAAAILELDAQLSVSPRWRRWVVWWNRLVAAVGGGLGLGVGIAMVMGEP